MTRREPARSSLGRAYVASTALHLVALPLLLLLFAAPSLDERSNFAPHVATGTSERVTIERRAVMQAKSEHLAVVSRELPLANSAVVPARIAHPIATLVTKQLTGTPLAFAPKRAPAIRTVTSTIDSKQRVELNAVSGSTALHATAKTSIAQAPATIARAVSGLGLAVATPTAAPTIAAAPAATPAPEIAHEAVVHDASARGPEAVPVGGWGQSFEKPIVADESALADLKKRYRLAASVAVAVDESGHATHVSIPASLPADIRANLEKELLALHYVPAECNGLRCTGTADVEL